MTVSEPGSEDPEELFAEYLERSDAEPELSPDSFLARAGPRREELSDLLALHAGLEVVRGGTTGAGVPEDTAATNGRAHPEMPASRPDFGRFRNLTLIGSGGLAGVYGADDTQLHRRVALKLLNPAYADAHRTRHWLLNEGRSIARIKHPGVVAVYEVDEIAGEAYIAMEPVHGPSLRDVLRCLREMAGSPERDSPPSTPAEREAAQRLQSVAARCELVAELAEALAACHEQGVIHRDIKPSNVLLADGRRPILIDFGLAHLESADSLATEITQTLMGTPAYVAPEQVDSHRTGASELSDQFSLGVLLVELLALRHPFKRESVSETMVAISHAKLPRPRELDPTISEDLDRICMHALSRDPSSRYARVADFAADLRAFLEHRAISLRAPTPAKLAALWMRRNRRQLAYVAVTVALGAVAIAGLAASELHASGTALRGEVTALQDSLPQRVLPADFHDTYLALGNLDHRAAALDASLLARLLLDPLQPAVDGAIHATSRRVSALFGEDLATIAQADTPQGQENRTLELLQRWSSVLQQDRSVCPECPYNREAAERGTVSLPAAAAGQELLLYRHGVLVMFPVALTLEPVPATAQLTPGFYRLILRDPAAGPDALDQVHEVEFALRYEQPRRAITPLAMDPAVRDSLMPCAGASIRLQNENVTAVPPRDVEVAPFLIARAPVSWDDLQRVWGPERGQQLKADYEGFLSHTTRSPVVFGGDEPAVLTWRLAQQFATDSGARLPTPLEWRAAFRLPGFHFPVDSKTYFGEWTSLGSYEQPGMRGSILYSARDLPSWNDWTRQTLESGLSPGITFRLARTSP